MLRADPQEALLLSVFFEEVAFHEARELAKTKTETRHNDNLGHGEYTVEQTIGDDDEEDWKESGEDT